MIYDFYSFGGESRKPLEVENFKKSKGHSLQIFNARQSVKSLDEYQGVTAFKEGQSSSHIDKLNIPSQDPRVTIVLDYHVLSSKTRGNKVKPLRLLETCSLLNDEFDAQIYICAYVKPLSDDHFKLLARFDDPAFQRVFEGLLVVPSIYRKECPAIIQNEVPKIENALFLHIDHYMESLEEYIRDRMENDL